MIMNIDPQQPTGISNALGDLNVASARLRTSAGMVVYQNECAGANVHRASDYLSRKDRRLVDRPIPEMVIVDQAVASIEVENPNSLDRKMSHVDRQIVEQGLP